MIVICDIDGTLANIEHRLHFVTGVKKDWDSFSSDENLMKDSINHWCTVILAGLNELDIEIVFVSGRWERSRLVTEHWLDSKGGFVGRLCLRADGDFREDSEVKRDILHKNFKKEDILFVLDDRTQVVNMWRSEGLRCLQVQGNDY